MPRNTGIGQRRNELSISLNPFWAISQTFNMVEWVTQIYQCHVYTHLTMLNWEGKNTCIVYVYIALLLSE